LKVDAIARESQPAIERAIFGKQLEREIVSLADVFSVAGKSEELYSTPMMALDEVSHAQVYQHCKEAFVRLPGRIDGIYINGGGWDAAPAIAPLERDLRTHVIWAAAADMWLTYKTMKISNPLSGYGAILTEKYFDDASAVRS